MTATLTRTEDLLGTLRTKQSQLSPLVVGLAPPRLSLDLGTMEVFAEQLEGGSLPGSPTRGGFDLNAERHELVAELRSRDTKAAYARATHLLKAIERVLSDDPEGFSALTPSNGKAVAPIPAAPPEPAPTVQPTRAELVQSAYAIASAYSGVRCTCGGGEHRLREETRTKTVRIETVHHVSCQLPPALSKALASLDPDLTLVATGD